MYKKIQTQISVVDTYAKELVQQGLFSVEEIENFAKGYLEELEEILKQVDSNQTSPR